MAATRRTGGPCSFSHGSCSEASLISMKTMASFLFRTSSQGPAVQIPGPPYWQHATAKLAGVIHDPPSGAQRLWSWQLFQALSGNAARLFIGPVRIPPTRCCCFEGRFRSSSSSACGAHILPSPHKVTVPLGLPNLRV
jgi:hypothetical protein